VELDLNWIFANIYLRIATNFESNPHFKPVDGKRVEQKRKEAQEYWLTLAAELLIHLHARLECTPSHHIKSESTHEPRLNQMFADLRELLETLVPDADHVSIAENLDVPFVMQQVENDVSRLADWLASLIKSHCAPMRGAWANQMTMQIKEGAQRGDVILLVKGIEKLFSVLEAMKLVSFFTALCVEKHLIGYRMLQITKFARSVSVSWMTPSHSSKSSSRRKSCVAKSMLGRAATGMMKRESGTRCGSVLSIRQRTWMLT
jgi:hypothetical protein